MKSFITCTLQQISLISSNQGGYIEHTEEIRNPYKILVEKPKGKRPFRRPRHRWEDIIRIDLRGTVWEVVDWIHLMQVRDQWQAPVNTVMKFCAPLKVQIHVRWWCKSQGQKGSCSGIYSHEIYDVAPLTWVVESRLNFVFRCRSLVEGRDVAGSCTSLILSSTVI
jgi:hypothetical protein